jgi:hypothetical protein
MEAGMSSSPFTHHPDEFPVLDLSARFEFQTATSISYNLGREEDVPVPSGAQEPWVVRMFVVRGFIDVHYPCDDTIKVRLRVQIASEYHVLQKQKAIVRAVFVALGIPDDERYQADFFDCGQISSLLQSRDRYGTPDKFYDFGWPAPDEAVNRRQRDRLE